MSISDSQNDTSLSVPTAVLMELYRLKHQQPFTDLINNLLPILTKHNLETPTQQINAALVNHFLPANSVISFTDQECFTQDNRFYEQIIFEDQQIPTRSNWHDFFNALIWCQFPDTKRYFNQLHQQEIAQYGLKQRSPIRDRLTHFDECGLVLFTSSKELVTQIETHSWWHLFVQNKTHWHQDIIPVIFGHALWEMLMNPFIGLTAKVKVVLIEPESIETMQNIYFHDSFFKMCDKLLLSALIKQNVLHTKRPWMPLPLLGIPRWSVFEQNEAFYKNRKYFMPAKCTGARI